MVIYDRYESDNKWLERVLRKTKDKYYWGKLQQNENDVKKAWRYVNFYN